MINSKFKIQNLKFKKGFTLLELLVVISIIAILVALGAVSYSTAQKKGRDARRKGDLRAVGAALEQYYSVCGNAYPTIPNTNIFTNVVCTSPSIAMMPTVPADPRGTPYLCSGTCDVTKYTLCTNYMESETNPYCINSQQ